MSDFKALIRSVEVTPYHLQDDGLIPNNKFPLLVYKGVMKLTKTDPAAVCEQVFAANRWGRSWRNGIYSFHHYHSTAHEVLGICGGEAEVCFGGEGGIVTTVQPGDVVVIPAGVGHKNLGSSPDLCVVGAYPPGPSWDLCRASPEEHRKALKNIAQVPLPQTDPIYGAEGPLLTHWTA